MKAVYLTGIRQFEIKEVNKPSIRGAMDVLIKITHVTVCGSDVHYYRHGKIGDQVVKFPFILGHECSGYVEEIGEQVTRVKKGDKIAIDPAVSCFDCDQCNTGRPHTCYNLKFLGCPGQLEGSMVEYIVLPEQCCYPVKASTSLVDAALIEPLSIGVYAVKRAQLGNTDKIAVFGFGPIGMSVMLAAKVRQTGDFFVIDKINERLNIAKQEGAKVALKFSRKSNTRQIQSFEENGVDVVFECCGQQEAVDEAIDILKPGGRLILIGIPEFDSWKLPADLIRRKELTIVNIRRQNECVQEAIDLVENGKISLKRMPTHFFDWDQSAAAFHWVDNYKDGVMKAVLSFE